MNEKLKFGLGRVENIVSKGENAGCSMFSKAHSFRLVKSRDCVVKGLNSFHLWCLFRLFVHLCVYRITLTIMEKICISKLFAIH